MKKKKAKTKAKVKAKAKPKTTGKAKAKAKIVPKPVSILKRAKIKPVRALMAISRKAVNIREDRRPEEKPLTNSEVQKFRDVLLQKQEELSEIVHRKKEEQEFQQEEPEIGDEADIATRSVEKELLFDITDTEKQTLDRIEAALRKIEKVFSAAASPANAPSRAYAWKSCRGPATTSIARPKRSSDESSRRRITAAPIA